MARMMVVLPVPGPPVMMVSRFRTAASTACFCSAVSSRASFSKTASKLTASSCGGERLLGQLEQAPGRVLFDQLVLGLEDADLRGGGAAQLARARAAFPGRRTRRCRRRPAARSIFSADSSRVMYRSPRWNSPWSRMKKMPARMRWRSVLSMPMARAMVSATLKPTPRTRSISRKGLLSTSAGARSPNSR